MTLKSTSSIQVRSEELARAREISDRLLQERAREDTSKPEAREVVRRQQAMRRKEVLAKQAEIQLKAQPQLLDSRAFKRAERLAIGHKDRDLKAFIRGRAAVLVKHWMEFFNRYKGRGKPRKDSQIATYKYLYQQLKPLCDEARDFIHRERTNGFRGSREQLWHKYEMRQDKPVRTGEAVFFSLDEADRKGMFFKLAETQWSKPKWKPSEVARALSCKAAGISVSKASHRNVRS